MAREHDEGKPPDNGEYYAILKQKQALEAQSCIIRQIALSCHAACVILCKAVRSKTDVG